VELTSLAGHLRNAALPSSGQTAEGLGLDPQTWTPVTQGVEYAHGPLA
jgi:hypothetical protein